MGTLVKEDWSDMGLSQKKDFTSWPMTKLGVRDPRVVLSLSQGDLLSTKTIFWPMGGSTHQHLGGQRQADVCEFKASLLYKRVLG